MQRHPARTLMLLAVAAGGVLLSACSSSSDDATVPAAEVEAQAATQLAEEVGSDELPTISCPEDLDAEVGATLTCELTAGDDPTAYAVEILVNEVDEDAGSVSFEAQVADEPLAE